MQTTTDYACSSTAHKSVNGSTSGLTAIDTRPVIMRIFPSVFSRLFNVNHRKNSQLDGVNSTMPSLLLEYHFIPYMSFFYCLH